MPTDAIVLPPGDWTLFDTPRLLPAEQHSLGLIDRAVLFLVRRRTREAEDFTIFRTIARMGRIFPGHSVFLAQLLGKTRLTEVEKELLVLRVAWRLGCAYEYAHHHTMTRDLGVPTAAIDAATTDDLSVFDARTAALLGAADELVAERKLSEAGWNTVTAEVSPDAALELCMFVGHYVMIAGIINTVGVQPEPHFAVRPPV